MKLRCLFVVHLWPPAHCAGGEFFCQNLAEYLISKGHEVRVLLMESMHHGITNVYDYRGVRVFPASSEGVQELLYNWSSHIFTHLGYAQDTIQKAHLFRKPVFFISHNSFDYLCVRNALKPVNVIYNSEWMREKLNYPQRSVVLRPALNLDKVLADSQPVSNEYVTLINCNERKGAGIVARIAERMPEKKFLFVTGSYDEQILPALSNCYVIPNNPNAKEIYAQTRILLMPSAYESYGMTCTEAMANGIPVIMLPTPGLKENAGGAGIFVDSPCIQRWMKLHEPPDVVTEESVKAWIKSDQTPAMEVLNKTDIDLFIKEIKKLDDEKNYFTASKKCLKRAEELNPEAELQAVEKFICESEYPI